jgi:hypothetical protein
MIAALADPVLVAIVALGGTLVGGLIAGCVQLLVATMSRSGQVELLRLQRTQETERTWRDHRRQIYSGYLTAVQTALTTMEEFRDRPSDATAESEFPDIGQVRTAVQTYVGAYSDLTLIAGTDVREVTYRVTEMIEDWFEAVLEDRELPERPSDLSHNTVVLAMQKELGINQQVSTPALSP